MKAIAFALTLSFAVPVLAQDAEAPSRDRICYGWLSSPTSAVNRIIARETTPLLKASGLKATQRGRTLACLAGAVAVLHEEVAEQCAVGADPRDLIRSTLATSLQSCISESAERPSSILPGPAEPETTEE